MNKLLLTTALAGMLSATAAMAGGTPTPTATPGHFTFLLGVGVEFGDQPDVGITGKILASPFSNVVAGGGATYFPGSGQIGLDLSAGLHFNGLAALGGYDFLTQKPQVSVGYAPVFTTLTCPPGWAVSGSICVSTVPSDRRLKRDIVHLATLSDGIKLYSFRYLDSETLYVGVMAQDLLEDPRFRHTVLTGADGFYLVDYDALELTMVTLDVWNAHGLEAMVLGSRQPQFLVEQAA